jgi:hypothetical protein
MGWNYYSRYKVLIKSTGHMCSPFYSSYFRFPLLLLIMLFFIFLVTRYNLLTYWLRDFHFFSYCRYQSLFQISLKIIILSRQSEIFLYFFQLQLFIIIYGISERKLILFFVFMLTSQLTQCILFSYPTARWGFALFLFLLAAVSLYFFNHNRGCVTVTISITVIMGVTVHFFTIWVGEGQCASFAKSRVTWNVGIKGLSTLSDRLWLLFIYLLNLFGISMFFLIFYFILGGIILLINVFFIGWIFTRVLRRLVIWGYLSTYKLSGTIYQFSFLFI